MKLNVARSFIKRVLMLSDDMYKDNNLLRIELILKKNNYPIRVIKKLTREELYKIDNLQIQPVNEVQDSLIDPNNTINTTITYIPTLSNKIQSILKSIGITRVSFKVNNKLQHKFTQLKDKIPWEQRTNIVYSIPCSCELKYVGQTSNSLKTRIQKHKSDLRLNKTDTALSQHIYYNKHTPDFNNTKILQHETIYKKRLFLECLNIINDSNNMNFRTDIENISSTYKFVLHAFNKYT